MQADIDKKEQEFLISIINPTQKNILEVGCGYGEQIAYLSNDAKAYFAIDSNPLAIRFLKNKYTSNRFQFLVGDASSLPFCENFFDSIISVMCFHEIEQQKQEQVVSEMIRTLKKTGKIVLVDPAFPSSPFQCLFDIAHRIIFDFDHTVAVEKSKQFILKENESFVAEEKGYIVKYLFEDIQDLLRYVFDSFSDETQLTSTQIEQISIEIRTYLASIEIDVFNQFILEDYVSVFVLKPMSNE